MSVSARTYAPQLFTMYEDDKIHNLKFSLVVESAMDPGTNQFEAFMDCINNSVQQVLQVPENEDCIIQLCRTVAANPSLKDRKG